MFSCKILVFLYTCFVGLLYSFILQGPHSLKKIGICDYVSDSILKKTIIIVVLPLFIACSYINVGLLTKHDFNLCDKHASCFLTISVYEGSFSWLSNLELWFFPEILYCGMHHIFIVFQVHNSISLQTAVLSHPSGCAEIVSVHGKGWGWFGTLTLM